MKIYRVERDSLGFHDCLTFEEAHNYATEYGFSKILEIEIEEPIEVISDYPTESNWKGFRLKMAKDMDWIQIGVLNPFLTSRVENIILMEEPNIEMLQVSYDILKSVTNIPEASKVKWQGIANEFNIPLTF